MELTSELVDALRRLDACSVSNAIETFNCRLRNEGFSDGMVGALFGDLPPVVGYAVTARIRTGTPPPVGHLYHDRTDWWNYINTLPRPRIVIAEDVDETPANGAFIGSVHAHILAALGCVAYITDGAVRDLPAVRHLGFQFFAKHVSVSHSFVHIVETGAPVTVSGVRIHSGDIVYGDRHGFLTIPPDVVGEIPRVAARMREQDQRVIDLCQSGDFSLDALQAAVRQLG